MRWSVLEVVQVAEHVLCHRAEVALDASIMRKLILLSAICHHLRLTLANVERAYAARVCAALTAAILLLLRNAGILLLLGCSLSSRVLLLLVLLLLGGAHLVVLGLHLCGGLLLLVGLSEKTKTKTVSGGWIKDGGNLLRVATAACSAGAGVGAVAGGAVVAAAVGAVAPRSAAIIAFFGLLPWLQH